MRCPLCSHDKTHKHGETSKDSQRYLCLNCKQTFTNTFNTIYYRRQISQEEVRIVLPAHCKGTSLRGINRVSGLSYNTGVSLNRAGSQKAQWIVRQQTGRWHRKQNKFSKLWEQTEVAVRLVISYSTRFGGIHSSKPLPHSEPDYQIIRRLA